VAYDLVRPACGFKGGRAMRVLHLRMLRGFSKALCFRKVHIPTLIRNMVANMNRRVFLQSLSATVAGITVTAVAQPSRSRHLQWRL